MWEMGKVVMDVTPVVMSFWGGMCNMEWVVIEGARGAAGSEAER